VRLQRARYGVAPVFKRVDTPAPLNLNHSLPTCIRRTRRDESDPQPRSKNHDPRQWANRIAQGIEFDYCCCHAFVRVARDGYETIMSIAIPRRFRPITTPRRLYFEPLTLEDVLAIVERESRKA